MLVGFRMLLCNVILTARGMLSEMFSKKCFQKLFPQESVNNLFNPESYILTQRKIYAYNTQIKNSIVLKKNPISLYIACMEINKKKTQGEDRKKNKFQGH